jgi:hypothetical protein
MRSTRKYLNKKTELDGYMFDSKREAERWAELKLLERAGDITDLKRQVGFVLAPAVRYTPHGRQKPALKLIADFSYIDLKHGGRVVVEDVKGVLTTAFHIKRHLMKAMLGITVEIVK